MDERPMSNQLQAAAELVALVRSTSTIAGAISSFERMNLMWTGLYTNTVPSSPSPSPSPSAVSSSLMDPLLTLSSVRPAGGGPW